MRRAFPFCTAGRSTRPVAEFVGPLRKAGVDFAVDVRTVPRSRTNPQFNTDMPPAALALLRSGCRHIRRSGGLRGRQTGQGLSRNTFGESASFRNHADYTATANFRAGTVELLDLGRTHMRVIMCAEAVWSRRHRRVIADHLLVGGRDVFHIMGSGKISPRGDALMTAMDRANAKHGRNALFPAAMGIGRGWRLRAARHSPRYTTPLDGLPRARA